MSLVAPIPDIQVRPRTSTRHAWRELQIHDLARWNEKLLASDASLLQYPLWNEPYRPLWLKPRYLAFGPVDRPLAFVCVLTLGFGPAKIGLVFRGPVSLHSNAEFAQSAIRDLLTWAHAQGYAFIRFTHSDERVLDLLSASAHVEPYDAFPYFLDYPVQCPDYIVDQFDDDEATLSSFDREARRKIRRAIEAGYQFRISNSADALAAAWPLYQDCSRRKHFKLDRSLAVYQRAIRLAQPHDCARIYSAYLNGSLVGSTLVFRDRATAHSVLAAFDMRHRHAAVFLHWHAMRDMHRLGASRYNLGPGPGLLARFKSQFCNRTVSYPGARTVVLKEKTFRLWEKLVFPIASGVRPTLRKLACHFRH